MNNKELIPHLFRSEYSKIVSVLTKQFGLSNIQLAEDLVSESFLKASETWSLNGIPENPVAWLYTVSKNNTRDYFKRSEIYKGKVLPELKSKVNLKEELEIDLSDSNIKDSQLQMLFAICNPINNNSSQIALALNLLCGFSIDEIANALLTNKSTINKRLFRAKDNLRTKKIELSFPSFEKLPARLDNVLSILYLLFNEGYYSSSVHSLIRKEFCYEAMRLLYLLLENKQTNLGQTNALMALFCFHASRFEAREDDSGVQVLLDDQDQSKWDFKLIIKGNQYLVDSKSSEYLSKYHLEAMIASWHTRTEFDHTEKWNEILQLYNRLLQQKYSPIIALNRTYALSQVHGKKTALKEALKIELDGNYFYHSLLSELYREIDENQFENQLNLALKYAKTESEKELVLRKLKR